MAQSLLGAAICALGVACAPTPQAIPFSVERFPPTIDRAEGGLLPQGADALDSYARVWWLDGHMLHGLLVQPSMVQGLEAGRVLLPGPSPYDVLDGGCGVIHVVYNPTLMRVESLVCNGES